MSPKKCIRIGVVENGFTINISTPLGSGPNEYPNFKDEEYIASSPEEVLNIIRASIGSAKQEPQKTILGEGPPPVGDPVGVQGIK